MGSVLSPALSLPLSLSLPRLSLFPFVSSSSFSRMRRKVQFLQRFLVQESTKESCDGGYSDGGFVGSHSSG